MKHWKESSRETKLIFAIGEDGDRVVAIHYNKETDTFEVAEQCDEYFGSACSREHLLEALQEAADWVRSQPASAT